MWREGHLCGEEGRAHWFECDANGARAAKGGGGLRFLIFAARSRPHLPRPPLSPLFCLLLPGGTGVTVASSSIWTAPLRRHRLRSTASPPARSAGVGARSAVRSRACTTGRGRPTTEMFVRASAVWAAAWVSTRPASVCMACVMTREGRKR
jgi:hypothetical protein